MQAVTRLHAHPLTPVPALLTNETPIPARLLSGDPALLAQNRRNAAPGQLEGSRGADDAAADDQDFAVTRQRRGCFADHFQVIRRQSAATL